MHELIIPVESAIDTEITKLWVKRDTTSWTAFVKSLDKNIIKVEFKLNNSIKDSTTVVKFKSPESKLMFILKYST